MAVEDTLVHVDRHGLGPVLVRRIPATDAALGTAALQLHAVLTQEVGQAASAVT